MKDVLNELKSFIDLAESENISTQAVKRKLLEFASLLGEDESTLLLNKYDTSISSLYSILYEPKIPSSIPTAFDNDTKFDYLYHTILTIREAIFAYSKGDLSFNIKSKGYVSGALKMLQSNLKHLTWQAQMVAKGDFTQKVDFMGDFADAFNLMIKQLDTTILALKNREIELTDLNATKDKFFSIISHDLRGPIGALKNLLDMMASDYDSFTKEEAVEFLTLMKDSTVNLFALLENLLIWSRSQRGLDEIHLENVDLFNIVKGIISVLKLGAEGKSIELISTIEPETFVFADANQITTIIRNLISNAIKFTQNGGKIEVGIVKSSDDYSIIYIKDNGVGMDEKIRDKLFRIDASITSVGTAGEKGTGLGLILCKEFVEKHGGKIWVESEEDKGSTFYFSLPKVSL
jgi:signal transduction histidine kinase